MAFIRVHEYKKERSELAVATVFRPMFDDSVSRDVDLGRDMFYFKLELHGAKIKTKNNLITAKVNYWVSR